MSDRIVTNGSGKCFLAGFMRARDGTEVPGARYSSAVGLEQERPPGTGGWLVSLWG